jgi:hypothetical protein
VLERVEERGRPVVEHVVIRERYAVDSQVGERLDRRGRRAERETLRRGLAALRDAALEVEHDEVGVPDDLRELGVDERLRRPAPERLGDLPPEHRVAGERDSHLKPCLP